MARDGSQDELSLILFENVQVFDGTHEALVQKANVLIRGNKIAEISSQKIGAPNATRIQGGGRVLKSGLTDAHRHTMMSNIGQAAGLSANIGYINQVATVAACNTLMHGFTSVRDMGGPVFGPKRAVDEGIAINPPIYPSGVMRITGRQTICLPIAPAH